MSSLRAQTMAILRSERHPVPIPALAKTLGVGVQEATAAVEELDHALAKEALGLRIVRRGDRVELQVDDAGVAAVRKYRGERPLMLSRYAKLTLVIVMALGPLTKKEIEERRGQGRGKRRLIDVGSTLERLLEQGLIAIAGIRADTPGRPRLYRATRKALDLYPDVPRLAQELLGEARATNAGDEGELPTASTLCSASKEDAPSSTAAHHDTRGMLVATRQESGTNSGAPSPPHEGVEPTRRTAGRPRIHGAPRLLPTVPAGELPREAPSLPSRYLEIEVVVAQVRPRIWRRFLLREHATFQDLHEAIQLASGSWETFHAWEFRTGGLRIGPSDHANIDVVASKIEILGELAREERCTYRYDFGDGWQIDVALRAVLDKPGNFVRKLAAGAGAWPPEDCGGPLVWRPRGKPMPEATIRAAFDLVAAVAPPTERPMSADRG